MARAYASFVLRCWRLGLAERRITVEHIEFSERTSVATLTAALVWLGARWSEMPGEQASELDQLKAQGKPDTWRLLREVGGMTGGTEICRRRPVSQVLGAGLNTLVGGLARLTAATWRPRWRLAQRRWCAHLNLSLPWDGEDREHNAYLQMSALSAGGEREAPFRCIICIIAMAIAADRRVRRYTYGQGDDV